MAVIGYEYDWVNGSDARTPVIGDDAGKVNRAFVSSNHRFDRKKGHYVSGGIFLNDYTETLFTSPSLTVVRPGFAAKPAYVGLTQGLPPEVPAIGDTGSLHNYGAELYRRARPDKPIYPLGNGLFELKDVPGQIRDAWRGFPKTLKGLSDWHVAVQFGWLPVLQDLRAIFGEAEKQRTRLAWLLRHNGKPVRRRIEMEPVSTTEVVGTGTGWYGIKPVLVTQCYAGTPSWVQTQSYTRKVWFSGKFVYYLPKIDTEPERDTFIRALFGLRPTPAAVWRGIPWTWLINWYSTIGDAFSNLTSEVAESIYSEYAYVMRQQQWSNEVTWHVPYYTGHDHSSTMCTASAIHRRVIQERDYADPFAFRWTGGSPSPFQQSILSALTVSRVRRR